MATAVIRWMKCSISAAMGVWPSAKPDVREAIRPMTVESPVAITIPRAVPVDEGRSRDTIPWETKKRLHWYLLPVIDIELLKSLDWKARRIFCYHNWFLTLHSFWSDRNWYRASKHHRVP